MLAPVEPARTGTFDLAPQTAADAATGIPEGASGTATGVSSAAFHDGSSTQQDAAGTGAGGGPRKKPQGVWRAWLIAGATRWGRGGGTHNKRLDMQKARAAAHQVKETRQTAVNRTGGLGGTSSGGRSSNGAGADGGKSLDSKSSKDHGSTKNPKTATPTSRDRGNGNGSSPSPKPGADKPSRTPKPAADNKTHTPKPSKDTSSSTPKSSTGRTVNSGKAGTPGAAGTPGKAGTNGKPDQPKKTTDIPKDTNPQNGRGTASTEKKPAPAPESAPGKATAPSAAGKAPEISLTKKGGKTAPKPAATDDKPKAATGQTNEPAKPTTPKVGKPFTVQPSRETGYRDGTRAARATAHARAYRDGVKDGWTDTLEVASREKSRLDQAHVDRKAVRQEQPVTSPTTSADRHQDADPTPIPVKDITSTHVVLGDGASRASMTRGEVRSLKSFERRLEERATGLDRRAEQTRTLKAHADEQAAKATRLLEAARGVKGGDKLVGTLTKLQEAAQVQAGQAEEIHKRSLRAAEQCRTVLSNVQTRYGGMYQAVVDSPETSPAELRFYKG
ncbi:hypothetical protein [Streptomyces halstedii]|uniref:hypothetical protein n=1 Tax=Streptomyces halstedii TaxID=1944 RepID=UPI003460E696